MQVRPTPIVSGTRSQPSRVVDAPAGEVAAATVTEPATIDLPSSDAVVEIQEGELPKVVEQVNKVLEAFTHSLRFEVTDTHRIIIRVVDTTSGEVVREIPPEKLMDTFNRLEDLVGLLLDTKL